MIKRTINNVLIELLYISMIRKKITNGTLACLRLSVGVLSLDLPQSTTASCKVYYVTLKMDRLPIFKLENMGSYKIYYVTLKMGRLPIFKLENKGSTRYSAAEA